MCFHSPFFIIFFAISAAAAAAAKPLTISELRLFTSLLITVVVCFHAVVFLEPRVSNRANVASVENSILFLTSRETHDVCRSWLGLRVKRRTVRNEKEISFSVFFFFPWVAASGLYGLIWAVVLQICFFFLLQSDVLFLFSEETQKLQK